MSSAVLLIAHGSRRPAANEDLVRVADMMAARCPELIIECSYLELAQPTIPQGMRVCVERGARHVRMLPYFLSAGAHVSQDLEAYRKQFASEYPEIDVRLCPPIGLDPRLIEILVDRLEQSLDETGTREFE